jgi:hypothetical protein
MDVAINVDLIENHLVRNKNDSKNKDQVERNSIQLFDFTAVNNIRICEKIKKIPYFFLRFEIFLDYNFIKIGDLHEKTLEQYNVINVKNNDKYVLFTYKNANNILFNNFILHLPTPKLFVFHIIDSFGNLLENLLQLHKKKICFFNLNVKNIVFNTEAYKPILRNFSTSILLNHLNMSYVTDIIKCTEEYTYTFKPLEVHVLFYLIHNNENTLSYSSIETICELFVKNSCILNLFSSQYREKYLQACIDVLKKYINTRKDEIIDDIIKYSTTWDNYSLCVLYLYFIGNFNKVFGLKECFLSKFSVLLNKNTNPDPLKRESLQTTQEEFHKLMDEYSDWRFVNDLSDEKYAYFLEKIIHN